MQQCVDQYFNCLTKVDISRYSKTITPAAFTHATHNNYGMRTLIARNAKNWFTDAMLVPALDAASRLVRLDLTNCSTVTNASIQKVAISCPELTDLSLRDCHWLSREGAMVLAMNAKNLEKLDLTGCWELDDESLIMISSLCQK